MPLTVTFGDKTPGGAQSAIARALLNASEERVRQHLAEFDRILKEEWTSAVNQANLGTSRPGTSRDRVTPIREAVSGVFIKTTFPMVAEMKVAPDAKPKFDALSGQRGAHRIDGNPLLVFPGTNDFAGQTIVRPKVNWRPTKGGFVLRPILVLNRAKRAWAKVVARG